MTRSAATLAALLLLSWLFSPVMAQELSPDCRARLNSLAEGVKQRKAALLDPALRSGSSLKARCGALTRYQEALASLLKFVLDRQCEFRLTDYQQELAQFKHMRAVVAKDCSTAPALRDDTLAPHLRP